MHLAEHVQLCMWRRLQTIKETRADSNTWEQGPDLLTSAVNIKASGQNLSKASWGFTLFPNRAWKFTGL